MKTAFENLRLCYVKDDWAYFDTRAPGDCWGDGWNKTPYEHNSSQPSPWDARYDPAPAWVGFQVAWEGPFRQPCDGHCNSPFSVREINAGYMPWLRREVWGDEDPIAIMAGTTLAEFIDAIHRAGGTVYLPAERSEVVAED